MRIQKTATMSREGVPGLLGSWSVALSFTWHRQGLPNHSTFRKTTLVYKFLRQLLSGTATRSEGFVLMTCRRVLEE